MTNKSTMLLEHNLKQLKLPTFLREYDKLASQCASMVSDGNSGHQTFQAEPVS